MRGRYNHNYKLLSIINYRKNVQKCKLYKKTPKINILGVWGFSLDVIPQASKRRNLRHNHSIFYRYDRRPEIQSRNLQCFLHVR